MPLLRQVNDISQTEFLGDICRGDSSLLEFHLLSTLFFVRFVADESADPSSGQATDECSGPGVARRRSDSQTRCRSQSSADRCPGLGLIHVAASTTC